MYQYFTAKIFDSLRQKDVFNRNYNWEKANTDLSLVDKPNIKGCQINTNTGTTNPNYPYVRKTIYSLTTKVGDLHIVRLKHDKPIQEVHTDFYPLNATVVAYKPNVNKGSYYESYQIRRATSAGTGRHNIEIWYLKDTGYLNIWDCEMLIESVDNLAKPIYLSTKKNIEVEGQVALPYLSIPDTRNRSIKPSDVSATASDMDINIYNANSEVSPLIYERINSKGTLFWNEKIEIYGHAFGVTDRIFLGHIENITNDPLETIYTIETMDVFKLLKTDIFSRELGIYTNDYLQETTQDINNVRLPVGFIAVEETYEGETIRSIRWSGNAINFIEAVLQIVFSKPENTVGVSYLTGDYLDYIDIASFQEVKNAISTNGDGYTFTFYDSIDDPFEFLKEQIFKPCTIFPYITNDGRLGLKIHQQPTSGEGVEIFDESKITGIIEKQNTMQEYVNHIAIDYNRKITKETDTFSKAMYAVDPDAMLKTRFLSPRSGPLKFELDGINFPGDSVKQEAVIQNIIGTFFTRYSMSITKIVFETTLSKSKNVKVSDYIGLNHKTLIEWYGDNAGNRGLEDQTIVVVDPIARLDSNDDWAGFVNNNTLGISVLNNNYVFLDTRKLKIKRDFFLGATQSCKKNHDDFDAWLAGQ